MSENDNKLGRPQVEPMSAAAWTRIERGVFERLDQPRVATLPLAPARRPRWPLFALPAVAAAAALVVLFVVPRGEPQAPVVVDEPSRVVSGDTPSQVSFADAHLTLDPHTAIVMTRETAGPSVVIDRGRTELVVAPRGDRPPFVVRAADVVVRVVGTQFAVSRSEERVSVEVTHGIVDVQYRAVVHRLHAGDSWTSEAPEQIGHAATAAANDPDPIAPPPAPAAPSATTTPAPSSPTVAAAPVPPQAAVDPRAEYDRLSALERRDPKAALEGYLQLSKGKTAWAPVALYAAGRLAADLKDPRAKTFLDIYLRRFPRGANADDARNLLTRLQGAR